MNKYEVLNTYFGYSSFRNNQEEIIDSILKGKDTLAILATGGGKSICFQIPGLMKKGLSLVISPLISLMEDQVKELSEKHIEAKFLHSDLSFEETKLILDEVAHGKLKFLYISPERLLNEYFKETIKKTEVNYIIVDEAHCMSIWGNDFRKSYQQIAPVIASLKPRPTVAAFTATASQKVKEDILQMLKMEDYEIYRGGFDRPNLYYGVVRTTDKLGILLKFLLKHSSESGIIYVLTRKKTYELYQKLSSYGLSVTYYHGGLSMSEKSKNQEAFQKDEKRIMIATNAFGMGINKSDVRYVINYELPLSLEDLSQQSGRCSRDGKEGQCYLYFDPKDISICEYFIKQTKCDDKAIEGKLKKEKQKQLKAVLHYADSTQCLHQQMVSYFGQLGHVLCNNCSNCCKKKRKK